jgi:acetyl esterase
LRCAALERVKREAPNLRSATMSPAESRAAQRKFLPPFIRLPLSEMASIEDREIPGKGGPIRIRIYTPKSAVPGGGKRPVALFFHTGGFVFGDLDSDDPQCRRIAEESGCIMVSVDYRLAPENKFPGAYEDALSAWDWMVANATALGGDGVRFGVSGGSAGGNLTAAVCRHAREQSRAGKGPAPTFQLVFVGGFNVPQDSVPSHAWFAMGGSNDAFARMVRSAYRGTEADQQDVRYAPLISDDFAGFAPAMVIVGECDAMCDEGVIYAEKLRASGVPVELYVAKGQVHQVFSWAGAFPEGPKVIALGAGAMRRAMERAAA